MPPLLAAAPYPLRAAASPLSDSPPAHPIHQTGAPHPPTRRASTPTIHVPDACPPPVSRMHTHHPCPGCIPTIPVPDACPLSHPQGRTLGWYALTLWGKPNPVLMAAQPRRLLECDCGMARSFPDSCPNGAACDNPGRRPGTHATHRPNPQTGAPLPPNRRAPTAKPARLHTHHPCPGCIPTILSPGLHPGLICVAPLGHMEPGAHGSSASVAVGM